MCIEQLGLSNNKFKDFPEEISDLENLKKLYVDRNLKKKVPENLKKKLTNSM